MGLSLRAPAAAAASLLIAVALAAPAGAAEAVRPAQTFIDAIGVNLHLSYHDGPYARFDRVAELLGALGVRHVRDGVTIGQDDVCREDRSLAAHGVRFTFITARDDDAPQLARWAACVGDAIEAYEGLNEYDISHPADEHDWAATVRTSQQRLFRSVKADASLAHLAVLGPSVTTPAAASAVGDLSGAMDAASMHAYFAGRPPETTGWGLGDYGSLAYNERVVRLVGGDRPIETTESGYGTGGDAKDVDAQTQAVYLPRLLLDQFAHGVTRTFAYELIDEGGPPFGRFGLVGADLQPKPAFHALASLIALLRDDDAGVTRAATLALRVSDGGNGLRHVLLRKRDGRYELALWRDAAAYDANAHRTVTTAAQTAIVQLGAAPRRATLFRYDGAQRLRPAKVAASRTLRVSVSGRVSVLELDPAGPRA